MKKNTNTGRWPCFSRQVKQGAAIIFSLLIVFMFVFVTDIISAPGGDGQGSDYKPPSKGGDIKFQPEGGTYTAEIIVRLSPGQLKSMNDDYISSYICYTLDGSEPSRTNGKKYSRPINISGPGTVTLKARLLSKVGMYEGYVCSRYYVIRANDQTVTTTSTVNTAPVSSASSTSNTQSTVSPPANSSTTETSIPSEGSTLPAGVVTSLESLDQETRDEIELKTEKVIIDAPGINNVKLERVVRMQLIISNMGKARVSDISGFSVEPEYKLSEIKTSLEQKFQNIKFSPPTIESNPVEVRLWLEFNKIAKFYEKVIFEKQGNSE